MSLRFLLKSRITWLWIVLVGATALSWAFGHGLGVSDYPRASGMAILVIAFVKARYVVLDFMEIRTAPIALRVALEAWALIVGVVLVALYSGSHARADQQAHKDQATSVDWTKKASAKMLRLPRVRLDEQAAPDVAAYAQRLQ